MTTSPRKKYSTRDPSGIAGCAKHFGCSERTAREYRQRNSPEWQEWQTLRNRGKAYQANLPSGPKRMPTREEEEENATRRLASIQELLDLAQERGDYAQMRELLKTANAAAKLLATIRKGNARSEATAPAVAPMLPSLAVESPANLAPLAANLQ